MLNIEKTLQSVRDLLGRLSKEGVEFALVESEYSDCIADIRDPNEVYVFLTCSICPNGTFIWRDYDRHKGVCDFDEFRVRIITLTADACLDKAEDKRRKWINLNDGRQVTCLVLGEYIRSGASLSCDWANAKETE